MKKPVRLKIIFGCNGLFAAPGCSYRGRLHLGSQLRSRTQNNVAPATAAGIISTFTPGIINAR